MVVGWDDEEEEECTQMMAVESWGDGEELVSLLLLLLLTLTCFGMANLRSGHLEMTRSNAGPSLDEHYNRRLDNMNWH